MTHSPSTRARAVRKTLAATTWSSGSPWAPLEKSSFPKGARSRTSARTAAARAPVCARTGPRSAYTCGCTPVSCAAVRWYG